MSDDTPTQRFDAQPAPAGPSGDKAKSRLPLILGIVGGVLLLVVILLLVLLFRGQGTPQAAGTNSPIATTTPSPTPTPTTDPATPTPTPSESHTTAPPPPPPPSTDPAFTKFVVQTSINSCSGGPYYTGAPPIVKVTWASIRTDSAWIVQGTSDAADSQFMQIPVSGNESNFPYEIDFSCGSPSSTYTITIVGSNGKHLSKHWTIKNTSPGP
jgi:cytoskeletal protein RodZ